MTEKVWINRQAIRFCLCLGLFVGIGFGHISLLGAFAFWVGLVCVGMFWARRDYKKIQ